MAAEGLRGLRPLLFLGQGFGEMLPFGAQEAGKDLALIRIGTGGKLRLETPDVFARNQLLRR